MSEKPHTLRQYTAYALESGQGHGHLGKMFNQIFSGLVFAAVLAMILATAQSMTPLQLAMITGIEGACVGIFMLEYVLRVWCAPEDRAERYSQPLLGRLKYMATPMAMVDLLAILPPIIDAIWPQEDNLMRVLRLIWLVKLVRYSPALETLVAVMRAERSAWAAAMLLMASLLCIAATLVWLVEHDGQPDAFGSIPKAMWWAIVTMTTVGYGDVTPHTVIGRMFAGGLMVSGLTLFALPAAIFAHGYMDELKRREFAVGFSIVASVPIFSKLAAKELASIARLLKPRIVPARFAIVRKGEPAEAMYFILAGSVTVDLPNGAVVRLETGDFFGEMALLDARGVRTATVTAYEESRLLVLDIVDFRRLMEDSPHIKAQITEIAEKRAQEKH